MKSCLTNVVVAVPVLGRGQRTISSACRFYRSGREAVLAGRAAAMVMVVVPETPGQEFGGARYSGSMSRKRCAA